MAFASLLKVRRFVKLRGLPQGDTLSGVLCDLYYGDMVESAIWPQLRFSFKKSARRFLVRGMDDFLFASTSRQEAEKQVSVACLAHCFFHSKALSAPLKPLGSFKSWKLASPATAAIFARRKPRPTLASGLEMELLHQTFPFVGRLLTRRNFLVVQIFVLTLVILSCTA